MSTYIENTLIPTEKEYDDRYALRDDEYVDWGQVYRNVMGEDDEKT